MSLNIKDPETHRMAKELARVTGETVTQAVRESVRIRLEFVTTHGNLSERMLEIGRDVAARVPEHIRSGNLDALLYDERGLPR
jgi:antitoxin VapB